MALKKSQLMLQVKKDLEERQETIMEPIWYADAKRRAILSLTKIMRGKAVGDGPAPRASDVLAAAKEVLARTDPIITRQESKASTLYLHATSANLEQLDNLLSSHYKPQDVVPVIDVSPVNPPDSE